MTRQAIRFANYSPGADIKVGDIMGPTEMREHVVVVSVESIEGVEIRTFQGTVIRTIGASTRAGFAIAQLEDAEAGFAAYEIEHDVEIDHPAFFKERS